ncbi:MULTISPECIES: hypothetical protein [unclassified Achromobacter]|uniref:hypothetical protein n=1 Tax=unclassified Achromobacter TaxID=2626865 RepID=UPI000B51CF33|nr:MULTISPECIES: hypothetical protein [unclassified Achromobacter]OWT70127.1 hypothetical protein CEY05_26070 [Achromobacter sp. HZ34]OWT71666.1 hypothetical protein CEY04_24905 [Achromobacter sp. HZ28]
MDDCRIGESTYSIAYLRELAAWAVAGDSASRPARIKCAAWVLCMQPGDVLIQRDDGKLEFFVKRLWGGPTDYMVIPAPRPGNEAFWPPFAWYHDAKKALDDAYLGRGSTAANGATVAGTGNDASARPPLPPDQEWAEYDMLHAALHYYPAGGLASKGIGDIAREQMYRRAYLIRSKHPTGLRLVAHASVRLPALTAVNEVPKPPSKPRFPEGRGGEVLL